MNYTDSSLSLLISLLLFLFLLLSLLYNCDGGGGDGCCSSGVVSIRSNDADADVNDIFVRNGLVVCMPSWDNISWNNV